MKKNGNVLLMLIGVWTFSAVITGCGDIGLMSELEGTWERGGGFYALETLTFSGDIVTYYNSMSTVNDGIKEGSYTIDGNKLIITMIGESPYNMTFALSADRKELIIHGSILEGAWTKR